MRIGIICLQLQVSLFINSDLPSVNMINTPIRGIVQRLKGKQGRFRCNLSGKRVDFSGRTVISPDPNLSVEQVGVPIHIAKILTVPEKVNHFNRQFLTSLVQNGVEKWPGANFIITKDDNGKEFKRFLMYGKNKELKIGDIVERHLLNDDVLLFNRQPSLHRMSIMAHKAKIHMHKTLRFNECDCSPYNADFDGDEMNIHLPQTLEARSEALELMAIRNNICTARNGEPLISCTQDFLTGSYLMTGNSIFFKRDRFAQLCSYIYDDISFKIRKKPAIIQPVELFTGKQLYEVLFEYAISKQSKDMKLNLQAKNRSFKSENHNNDGYIRIKNSIFISGRLDKSIIGGENRKGSLIYQLLKISKNSAVAAMNSISRLSTRYLAEVGFSIGLDDVYPGNNLIKGKNKIVNTGYNLVEKHISENIENLEMEISSVLNKIREECGNVCINELSVRNSPIIMQDCGSKGSKINVSQMIACVGQQIISGHRIPDGMFKRTLPHFKMNDMGPQSKGFVFNSFFTGMHGYEFFFHSVSGREGLVDTAVKTAETGYMQRRLMKALEDLSVKYDYSVRNSANDLVQFIYGEDNVQPLKNEAEEFFEWVFVASVVTFQKLISDPSGNHLDSITYDFTGHSFSFVKSCEEYFQSIVSEDIYYVNDLIENTFNYLKSIEMTKNMINEKYQSDFLKFLNAKLNDSYFYRGSFYKYFQNRLFIKLFLENIKDSLINMVIEPGTAAGAIAGQSIGEPGTQMTLKTFHFAGVASMSITLGVPRLKEIINAAENISTPIINGKLLNPTLESAKVVKSRLERLTFGDICNKVVNSTSSEGMYLTFSIDYDLIKKLRLEINIDIINTAICRNLKNISTEIRGETIAYFIKRMSENSMFIIEKIKKQILNVKIRGLDNVTRAIINKINDDNYELLIEGKNFSKILGTPGIEPYSTTSNDILQIEAALGIEAARNLIIREVEYTMGKHGIKVDSRHIMLLSDTMCFKGKVLGITRFGIGKMRASTLMLASFEQTADYLFDAAVKGKEEKIDGVSESIIMGLPISLGTGSHELLWKE